jgi:hypothetical protein
MSGYDSSSPDRSHITTAPDEEEEQQQQNAAGYKDDKSAILCPDRSLGIDNDEDYIVEENNCHHNVQTDTARHNNYFDDCNNNNTGDGCNYDKKSYSTTIMDDNEYNNSDS